MKKRKRKTLGVKNEKVKVLVRIKPLGAGGGGDTDTDKTVHCGEKSFEFFRVLAPEVGQIETYQYVIGDLVDMFLGGVDVNILAYGQTGSGKTHTLLGPPKLVSKYFNLRNKMKKKGMKDTQSKISDSNDTEEEEEESEGEDETKERERGEIALEEEAEDDDDPQSMRLKKYEKDLGVFPRAAKEILKALKEKKKKGSKYSLTATMVEIHVMEVYDLLNKRNPVGFEKNECMLKGEVEWDVDDEDDMMKLLTMSESRVTGSTLINDTSSRSHLVVTLYFCEHNRVAGKVRTSKFTVVDLGGSERAHEAHGDVNVKGTFSGLEGLAINFSLFILLWCVETFAKNRKNTITKNRAKRMKEFIFCLNTFWFGLHLPCLIWGSFVGTSLTRIFINVSQAPKNAFQSSYALDFGRKASLLKMRPQKNAIRVYQKLVTDVRKKLRENKSQLERLLKVVSNNKNQKYIKKRQNEEITLRNQLRRLLKVK